MTCLKKEISILTSGACDNMTQPLKSLRSIFSQVEDIFSLLGVLGSAAACKGGPFAEIGDKIASFFNRTSMHWYFTISFHQRNNAFTDTKRARARASTEFACLHIACL